MHFTLSRRGFIASSAALSAAPMMARAKVAEAPVAAPQNPLVRQRADAQIFRHDDGHYYMTGSVPEYDRLVLRRSKTIAGLTSATEAVLWRHEKTGPLSGFIWAPNCTGSMDSGSSISPPGPAAGARMCSASARMPSFATGLTR